MPKRSRLPKLQLWYFRHGDGGQSKVRARTVATALRQAKRKGYKNVKVLGVDSGERA